MPKITKEEFDYGCSLFADAIKEVNDNLCACKQRIELIAEMLQTFEETVALNDFLDALHADDPQPQDLVVGFFEAVAKQAAEQRERERTQKSKNPAGDIDSGDWTASKPN